MKVATLDGNVLPLPVPEVATPKSEKRIAGRGMPMTDNPSQNGDLVVRFDIQFPSQLDGEQKAQLQKVLG